MKNAGFVFAGALLSMSAFLALGTGCGSSSTTTGSGGSTSTTTAGTGGAGGSTTTTGTGGSGGSVVANTCDAYCAANLANCKDANAQWTDAASCKAACAAFPAGVAGATDGNSLACRIYHSGAAAGDPATHCSHAGPTGGDKDPTDAAGGPCGDGCEAFCAIALKICPAQYADAATCTTECRTFKADVAAYSTANTSTNDFGCRMYHLSVAATGPDQATMHCGHIIAASPVCTN